MTEFLNSPWVFLGAALLFAIYTLYRKYSGRDQRCPECNNGRRKQDTSRHSRERQSQIFADHGPI